MLNNIINIFSNLTKGLGVVELPKSVYTEKQPITSADFKKFVNEIFLPKIQAMGFKGKDFYYYRENKIYTEAIFFWTHRVGGAVQVDLLVKFNNIKNPTIEKLIKPQNIRPVNADFFYRLSENKAEKNSLFKFNTWFWIFKEKDEDNKKVVNDIWRVFSNQGLSFFERFKNHEEYIGKINRKNYLDFPDFQLQRFLGTYELGILYFLFEYWLQSENREKANEFAKIALEKSNDNTNELYSNIFNEYLKHNK